MFNPFRSAVAAVLVGAVFVSATAPSLIAQEVPKPTPIPVPEIAPESELTTEQQVAGMLEQLHARQGLIELDGVAEIRLADGWYWLDSESAQDLLEAFGNQRNPAVRGLALPPDYAQSEVFAVYMLDEDGHVEDEEPDYDELLETMQEAAREGSKLRQEAGMGGVELIGWAEAPHYDKQNHKLYWAKELLFEGSESATLNYNVRVLGRTGNIEINGVGDIAQLALVDTHCKELLEVTEFTEGKRYTDFDPDYDKLAAYGIGGLIAGKIALKVGLFAKLGIFLLKFLKPLLVGFAVVGGILFKAFGGKKKKPRVRRAAAETMPPIEEQ